MIQIGIFLICAQTIIHFRPKAVYEKYFRWLLGMMILALFVTSLFHHFPFETGDQLENLIAEIQINMDRNLTDFTGGLMQETTVEEEHVTAPIEEVQIELIQVEAEDDE